MPRFSADVVLVLLSIWLEASSLPSEEKKMMRTTRAAVKIPGAILLVLCIVGTASAADQIPNIKGKWVGKTHTIVAGVAPHWPSNRGTFEKPGLFEKDLAIEVTAQDGRRFWGMQTFTGNGESTQEPMIGELTGKDNKTVVLVDRDGYLDGQLIDDNTLSFCYKQVGGQAGASVVSCSEIKRTP
jgi:hypothetical protein